MRPPVTIAHVVAEKVLDVATRKTLKERKVDYWQATSKGVGNCGHRHRSENAAESCLVKLRLKWHRWRYNRPRPQWVLMENGHDFL